MSGSKPAGYFKITLFTLFTVSLCNISIANTQKDSQMQSEQDKVTNVVQQMTEAFHQKDINHIMASYEHGSAIMFKSGTAISAPEAIKKMFAGAFQINPKFTYPKGHEVYIANDLAMHIAPWVMTGKTPDGTDITETGLSVAVLRKQENGHWLIVLDNPNSQTLMNQ